MNLTDYSTMLAQGREQFHARTSGTDWTCTIHDTPQQCTDEKADNFRIDSQTGQCIWDGWVINEDIYIGDEERAEKITQELWGQTIEEAYDDDSDTCYWTQWL